MQKKTDELADEEVVEKVRREDKELFAEIIRRYQDKLMRYARYLVGEEQMAADVVQEALIKAYVNLNGFNTKKKFSAWMYRIVHNEAMNKLKKEKKYSRWDEKIEVAGETNLEDDLVKRELEENIKGCLEEMPVKYREVLGLYYGEEKSYEEIGDILRIPVGTVGTWINRGKVVLRKICQRKKM